MCAYILLLAVLHFGPAQRVLTRMVSDELSGLLAAKVTVGRVEIGLFNRIMLKELRVQDRSRKDMLHAGTVTAKVELRSLIGRSPLALRSVSLLDADIRLYKANPSAPTNFQFVIDAFSNPKKQGSSHIDLRINSLILRRVRLCYDELYKNPTPGRLNFSHLGVSGLNANISLKHLSEKDLALRVRSFSLSEQSGLRVSGLSFKLFATRTRARIEDLEMRMPHSVVRQKNMELAYDVHDGLGRLLPTLRVRGHLGEARISTDDLAPFLPSLRGMHLLVHGSTDFEVSPRQIRLSRLSLHDDQENFRMTADAFLSRSDSRVSGGSFKVDRLEVSGGLMDTWAGKLAVSPQIRTALSHVGDVRLRAVGYYKSASGGAADLTLQTDAGLCAARATWEKRLGRISSEFRLTEVNPSHILSNPDLPHMLTAQGQAVVKLDSTRIVRAEAQAHVSHLVWRQHHFSPIDLSGEYGSDHVKVKLNTADPIVHVDLQTTLALVRSRITGVSGRVDVRKFVPSALGIHTRYGDAAFAGKLQVDLHDSRGLSSSALPEGSLHVRDFSLSGNGGGGYALKNLWLQVESPATERGSLELVSDFADVRIQGALSVSHLKSAAGTILNRSLPGLWKEHTSSSRHAKWSIEGSVKRTDFFERMLGWDFSLDSPLLMRGTVDAGSGRTALTLNVDGWKTKNMNFGASSLYLNGQGHNYQLLAKTSKKIAGIDFDCLANLKTENGALLSEVRWKGRSSDRYEGHIQSSTRFDGDSLGIYPHLTTLDMQIRPTQFVLADTVWNIASGSLSLKGRALGIRNFSVSHADQILTADGRIAPGKNDSIVARLKNIDVDYILGLVDFHAVEFGGRASGTALFSQRAGSTEVSARLNIPQFTFNQGRMGAAYIMGSWRKDDNRIRLDADMRLPRVKGEAAGTSVEGYVDLANKELSLDISARQTNLQFLRRYVDGIFDKFDGRAVGHVRIYGPFKKLDFDGRVKAEASAGIMATGVRYQVSGGDVIFSPGSFAFRGFKISDGRGGSGEASGELRHTHLKNLNYDFNVSADRLLCYDRPQMPDLPFYSTTVGTGQVRMRGVPGSFVADISLRPNAPTFLVYSMGGGEALGSSDNIIRFHDSEENLADSGRPADSLHVREKGRQHPEEDGGTDVKLNFLINATPEAQVKIVTDPRTGDAITVYGNGPIRASWHNKGDFEMYGTYTLSRGTYNLSLQDVIRKELTMMPGSTLTFSGDPLEADLDLRAKYTVSGASLSDLNYGAGFSQKSVKVDCLLNIGGKAKNPQISFDLDLQGISEDEKQMVRQLIATDEDMNRQVIYLLGIGRFYSANTESSASSVTTQQQSSAAMRSFLSSTLTGQLNSAISSVLGNDSHWRFGTNLAPGTLGWSDLEVEGLLQGRLLNDRLLINGNFGYRDRPTYTSNFIGDFDIRYLLTPRGSVSLRAYSETTDRYFTKSSMTTQGIGLNLQKDFNRFKDLFWWRKKSNVKAPDGKAKPLKIP